jgi:transcriptional regulator with XRE-family HTH domain
MMSSEVIADIVKHAYSFGASMLESRIRTLIRMDFKERLAAAIKRANTSRPKLVQALGVSSQAVSQVLAGDTKALTAENTAKAARFLQVDWYWLATGEGSPEPVHWPFSAELRSQVAKLSPDALLNMENMLRATFGMKAVEKLEPSIVRASEAIDMDQGVGATDSESLTDEQDSIRQTGNSRKAGARSLTSVPERAPVWPDDKSLLGPKTAPPKEDGKDGARSKNRTTTRKRDAGGL